MIAYSNPRPYNAATGQSLATAVQGYLQKVGVECTIDTYDWTTYKEKVKAGDYDVAFYGWIGDNGDPDNFLCVFFCGNDNSFNMGRPILSWQHCSSKRWPRPTSPSARNCTSRPTV